MWPCLDCLNVVNSKVTLGTCLEQGLLSNHPLVTLSRMWFEQRNNTSTCLNYVQIVYQVHISGVIVAVLSLAENAEKTSRKQNTNSQSSPLSEADNSTLLLLLTHSSILKK